MREAKRDLKEKSIKAEDVKYLPPIEDLCKPTPSPSVKVNSFQYFNAGDVPYGKPSDQCLDELDNFIVKQGHFNMRVENHLLENSRIISKLQDVFSKNRE